MAASGNDIRKTQMTQKMTPVMTRDEVETLLRATFPQAFYDNSPFQVMDIRPAGATLRLKPDVSHLRHGGTVSGPSMFALADVAAYMAILAHVGPAAMTVTTNMNINFLQKPAPEALDAHATILKLGRRLAVTEIAIVGADDDIMVAHATATYSIPPSRDTKPEQA